MTAEEYWEGDNTLPYFYRKAYKLRVKNKRDENNFNAWLQGQYMLDAIAACFTKSGKYPEKPYEFESKMPELKTEAEEQEFMRQAAEGFAAFVFAKNKERKRKQGLTENNNNLQNK